MWTVQFDRTWALQTARYDGLGELGMQVPDMLCLTHGVVENVEEAEDVAIDTSAELFAARPAAAEVVVGRVG